MKSLTEFAAPSLENPRSNTVNSTQPFLREIDPRSAKFECLLQHLHPERDRAGELYEDMRRRLNKFFQWNYCFPAEDLTDLALDRVAHKLTTDEVHNLQAFIWGVAHNMVKEFRKQPATISMEDLPATHHPHTGHAETQMIHHNEMQRRLECLRKCMQKLPAAHCELFLEYPYYTEDEQNVERLAERLQISTSAVQARAHRVKHKVQRCVCKCLQAARSEQYVASRKPRSTNSAHD